MEAAEKTGGANGAQSADGSTRSSDKGRENAPDKAAVAKGIGGASGTPHSYRVMFVLRLAGPAKKRGWSLVLPHEFYCAGSAVAGKGTGSIASIGRACRNGSRRRCLPPFSALWCGSLRSTHPVARDWGSGIAGLELGWIAQAPNP